MESKFNVKFLGVRGSTSIFNKKSFRYGGNTTCVQIKSESIDEDTFLIIDAGTGIVPLGKELNLYAVKNQRKIKVIILFTHYHIDHIVGLPLAPFVYNKKWVEIVLIGPIDQNYGPKEMIKTIMNPPFFPVNHTAVASHFKYNSILIPNDNILLFHKVGGHKMMLVDEFENLLNKNSYIPIGKGKYPIEEILVIKMLKTTHPEHTISYRFEDNMSGKVFVFLTDHENTVELSNALRAHLKNTNVLAMDSQYDKETYKRFTAGFGHGTPEYCAKAAIETNTEKLYLIHHDPDSDDEKIDSIVADCNKALEGTKIVAIGASDYLEIEV